MQILTLFGVESIINRSVPPINEEEDWKVFSIRHEGGELNLHLHFKVSKPPFVSSDFVPRRPTVGDKVLILPGGARESCADPQVVDGMIYTIEEDDGSPSMPYRINKVWVLASSVKLVD